MQHYNGAYTGKQGCFKTGRGAKKKNLIKIETFNLAICAGLNQSFAKLSVHLCIPEFACPENAIVGRNNLTKMVERGDRYDTNAQYNS